MQLKQILHYFGCRMKKSNFTKHAVTARGSGPNDVQRAAMECKKQR